jgi:hypothetical protein
MTDMIAKALGQWPEWAPVVRAFLDDVARVPGIRVGQRATLLRSRLLQEMGGLGVKEGHRLGFAVLMFEVALQVVNWDRLIDVLSGRRPLGWEPARHAAPEHERKILAGPVAEEVEAP